MDTRSANPSTRVQRLTLGLGSIVTDNYGAKNPDGFAALLASAAGHGIARLDTAAAYGSGESEALLGRWSRELGLTFAICTKIGVVPAADGIGFASNAEPAALRRQAEASLMRLGVERVDTLLLHRPDPSVAPRRAVEGLVACREAGLAERIGISNFPDDVAIELMGEGLIDVIQYPWSLLDSRRTALLDTAGSFGVERMVFGTLAYGILAGSANRDAVFGSDDWRGIARSGRDPGTNGAPLFLGAAFDRALSGAQEFARLAGLGPDRIGEAAIAASLAVAPAEQIIVGCRSAAELDGLVGGAAHGLPAAALAYAAAMSVM